MFVEYQLNICDEFSDKKHKKGKAGVPKAFFDRINS